MSELVRRLRDNSVGPDRRDELMLECGKLAGAGCPQHLVDGIIKWNDLMHEAADALERRWIPVGERLPDFDMNLLVRMNDGSMLGNIRRSRSGFTSPTTGYHYSDVSHWMPLPPPPAKRD